jgi:acetolactate synthase-1/2/3 large subunit
LPNRVVYSKSFGALGCGIGKAIGVYYATHKHVLCFVGDQGVQMNIQELQFIAQHQLPITVVILNNQSSGMIKDRERIAFPSHFVHTTKGSGYSNPDFQSIAKAYAIDYLAYDTTFSQLKFLDKPQLIEVRVDETLELTPSLPKGALCQDLYPRLDSERFNYLNSL